MAYDGGGEPDPGLGREKLQIRLGQPDGGLPGSRPEGCRPTSNTATTGTAAGSKRRWLGAGPPPTSTNAGSQLVAEYAGTVPAALRYLTPDHLGSTRVVTAQPTGRKTRASSPRHDYLPFGQEIEPNRGKPQLGLRLHRLPRRRPHPEVYRQGKGHRVPGSITSGHGTSAGREAGLLLPMPPSPIRARPDPRSWNLYSYTRNYPLKYVDSTGNVIETAWDAVNVGIGIASFVHNVKQGNYGWAAVDAIGVAVDLAATGRAGSARVGPAPSSGHHGQEVQWCARSTGLTMPPMLQRVLTRQIMLPVLARGAGTGCQ